MNSLVDEPDWDEEWDVPDEDLPSRPVVTVSLPPMPGEDQ